MEPPTKRAAAISDTINEVLKIIDERNDHEEIRKELLKLNPHLAAQTDAQKSFSGWYIKLDAALSKLYGRAYQDSIDDAKNLK